MSYLALHFQEGPVLHLKGSERHYLGWIVDNAAFGAIGMTDSYSSADAVEALRPFVPEFKTPRNGAYEPQDLMLLLKHGSTEPEWRGKKIAPFALRLNTAIAVGSDPVALAAKMHGTCEIHGYFLGKDRAWLADVIEQGLRTNIFRRGFWAPRDRNAYLKTVMKIELTEDEAEYVQHSMGWTEIVEQLRTSDEGAVVMSSSVTGSFPQMPDDWTPEGPVREPENDWETRRDIKEEMFGELPDAERFALGLAELRSDPKNLPISPDTLRAWPFRHELSLLDLFRNDIPKIEKQLGLTPEE